LELIDNEHLKAICNFLKNISGALFTEMTKT